MQIAEANLWHRIELISSTAIMLEVEKSSRGGSRMGPVVYGSSAELLPLSLRTEL